MKSSPEQTARRRELKLLVQAIGEMAWRLNPHVAPCAVIAHRNSPVVEGVIDYDEFFVFEHTVTTMPAAKTGGNAILRFRRRVTKDRKNEALWHLWEPEYAATKPETVAELLPAVRNLATALRRSVGGADG